MRGPFPTNDILDRPDYIAYRVGDGNLLRAKKLLELLRHGKEEDCLIAMRGERLHIENLPSELTKALLSKLLSKVKICETNLVVSCCPFILRVISAVDPSVYQARDLLLIVKRILLATLYSRNFEGRGIIELATMGQLSAELIRFCQLGDDGLLTMVSLADRVLESSNSGDKLIGIRLLHSIAQLDAHQEFCWHYVLPILKRSLARGEDKHLGLLVVASAFASQGGSFYHRFDFLWKHIHTLWHDSTHDEIDNKRDAMEALCSMFKKNIPVVPLLQKYTKQLSPFLADVFRWTRIVCRTSRRTRNLTEESFLHQMATEIAVLSRISNYLEEESIYDSGERMLQLLLKCDDDIVHETCKDIIEAPIAAEVSKNDVRTHMPRPHRKSVPAMPYYRRWLAPFRKLRKGSAGQIRCYFQKGRRDHGRCYSMKGLALRAIPSKGKALKL